MKDMRVEVKISTYLLLSDELPGSTMFPVMRTSPSNLLPHTPPLPPSHHHKPIHCQFLFSSSDNEESSAVHIPYNYSTSIPQNPMGFAQQPLSKSIYTICEDLEEEEEEEEEKKKKKKKKIFKQLHWMMTESVPDRHLCIP